MERRRPHERPARGAALQKNRMPQPLFAVLRRCETPSVSFASFAPAVLCSRGSRARQQTTTAGPFVRRALSRAEGTRVRDRTNDTAEPFIYEATKQIDKEKT